MQIEKDFSRPFTFGSLEIAEDTEGHREKIWQVILGPGFRSGGGGLKDSLSPASLESAEDTEGHREKIWQVILGPGFRSGGGF